tara:strand:+ start:470 stop:955 length:486 start_codon:yes stop_codon:yes gene_type:complete
MKNPKITFSKYFILRDGSLYNRSNGNIIKNNPKEKLGYVQYKLTSDSGEYKDIYAHRLVASEYLGLDLSDSNLTVDHINGMRNDNRVENLRVCTLKENIQYGYQRRNALPKGITKHISKSGKTRYNYRRMENGVSVQKASVDYNKVLEFKKEYENNLKITA